MAARVAHGGRVIPDLAILYEHPEWFKPLFAALDRRGIAYQAILLTDHLFDPADRSIPAPVVLSRVAMSGFLRDPEHGIFYAQSLLAHWRANGAHVLNGPEVLAVDASKARQLSLIAGLGLGIPSTRVVHRREEICTAARDMTFPLLLKASVGGSGAAIARYDSEDALAEAVRERFLPESVDNVLLVQDHVPARGGAIVRVETLAGNLSLRDRGGDRGRVRSLHGRRLRHGAGRAGGADDRGHTAGGTGRGGRAHRAGGGARCRRDRISDRRS